MSQPTPPVITTPFAKNAGAPYIQKPIPVTTVLPGRASMDQGFPPNTMQEKVAGGIPPRGQDMNGILFMLTSHICALQAGQPYLYSLDVATAIGGYAKGTVLGMADGTGLWINQTANNTTDPDAGGAGWKSLYRYDYATIPVTGGIVTASAMDAASPVIVLTGVLVSNLQLVLPANLQRWLIVNSTTGDFAVTVKTAGGTGVVVPAGGFPQPSAVYGDGTNIYPGSGTIITPSAVSPIPSTLLLRSNDGTAYASRFDDLSEFVNTFGPRTAQSYTLPGGFKYMFGAFVLKTTGDHISTVVFPVVSGPGAFTTPPVVVVSGAGNVTDPSEQLNYAAVISGSITETQFKAIYPNNDAGYGYYIAMGY